MGKFAKTLHIGVHGELRVVLDHDTLQAGDTLTGSVELRVTKPLTEAKLSVRLWGCERMDWSSTDAGNAAFLPHRRSWQYLGHDIALNETNGDQWTEGDYVYPFSFDLPYDSPHSFTYTRARIAEMENICVKIMYCATAKLHVDGILTADLETEVPFTVVPPPLARPIGKPICITRTHDIKALRLFKSGTCTVTLRVPTNVVSPVDETIATSVEIDLATTKRLKYVKVTLFEDVVLDRHGKYLFGLHRLSRPVAFQRQDQDHRGAEHLAGHPLIQIPLTIPLQSFLCKDGAAPIFSTSLTQFLWIGYRIEVDCGFSSLASRVKFDAPITMVRSPSAA